MNPFLSNPSLTNLKVDKFKQNVIKLKFMMILSIHATLLIFPIIIHIYSVTEPHRYVVLRRRICNGLKTLLNLKPEVSLIRNVCAACDCMKERLKGWT